RMLPRSSRAARAGSYVWRELVRLPEPPLEEARLPLPPPLPPLRGDALEPDGFDGGGTARGALCGGRGVAVEGGVPTRGVGAGRGVTAVGGPTGRVGSTPERVRGTGVPQTGRGRAAVPTRPPGVALPLAGGCGRSQHRPGSGVGAPGESEPARGMPRTTRCTGGVLPAPPRSSCGVAGGGGRARGVAP